jgi:SAM-dependent methyltransferase
VKSAACTLCGVGDSEVLFEGRDRLHGGPGHFAVHQCRLCGTLYLNPRPEEKDLELYYPDDYVPYASGRYLSAWQQWNLQLAVSKQVRAITSRIPDAGRALDVGCATGDFLAALQEKGWHVQGVELNPQIAAFAQETIGDEVFAGSLLEAVYSDQAFDLVTFWDVLEHLADPRQALVEAARITRPSGSLVLSLPNPSSLEARLFGTNWAGWDIPRHLWWFPKPALVRLLAETGWKAQEFICLRGRHWLLALSLRLWLEEQSLPETLHQGLLALFQSLPVKALLWPYFAIVERLGLGSIIVVFARRKDTSSA